ncbi:hypothetical protein JX266_004659 [Neoarthrinium moseri]|nr:hypothetical protein JX266_004659 [Neoarthrinium moseri]
MKLLDSASLQLREFADKAVPPYAILSHTWGSHEVSHDEMIQPNAITKEKFGYIKIGRFASKAREGGWNWIWVDTCCIRKESSAELSEAINSMYRWYKDAGVCFIYLDDLTNGSWENEREQFSAVQSCRWLTRGWTLQELIAPANCRFYASDWTFLFTKSDWVYQLSMMLGVAQQVLVTCDPTTASVAQRMSWAAGRETTRSEDMAYCLLGIFDVNMPMLYGEGGEKAFIRLQEEIMKASDDHSLFAWRALVPSDTSYHGLLAPSPAYFNLSRNMASVDNLQDSQPFTNTNKGISIKMSLLQYPNSEEDDTFIALLNCRDPGPEGEPVGIYIKQLWHNQYARIMAHRIWNALEFQPEQLQVKDTRRHDEKVDQYIETPRGSTWPPPSSNYPIYSITSETGHYGVFGTQENHYHSSGYVPMNTSLGREPTSRTRAKFSIRKALGIEDPEDPVVAKPRQDHGTIGAYLGYDPNQVEDPGSITPTDLYVRQSIRLPPGHSTPRVFGFVVTEFIQVPGIVLEDVWPNDSWHSELKVIRIMPTEWSKMAVMSYRLRDDDKFGVLAVLLRWNRKMKTFDANCVQDASWLYGMHSAERIKGLEGLWGSAKVESPVEIGVDRYKAKVELELGMLDQEVVIKVAITVR